MQFEEAYNIVANHGIDMLSKPDSGLTAVAVGCKDGGPITKAGSDDFTVTAFVKKKLSKRELTSTGIMSFDSLYSVTVEKKTPAIFDINVVESGSAFKPLPGLNVPVSQQSTRQGSLPTIDTRKKFSTLMCGMGVTNPVNSYPNNLSVGTIGFFMEDNDDNKYLVSNNHVIGRNNSADMGEDVVQPGTLDLTPSQQSSSPTLADLSKNFKIAEISAVLDIIHETPTNIHKNRVDAALAKLMNTRDLSKLSKLAYGGNIQAVAAPYTIDNKGRIIGSSNVYKVGRTTGITEGKVTGLLGTCRLLYNGTPAYFVNQIIVNPTPDNGGPFSLEGDSGSGIFDERHELVGLLFAGTALQSLVNPIKNVIDELRKAFRDDLKVITA